MVLTERYTKSRIIPILIFLFPVAGVEVRHWFSGIAAILVLVGIYLIISNSIRMKNPFFDYSRDEKTLSFLVAALFLSYLVSGFVNGWNDKQLSYFAGELNFLFFIPLYFVIKRYNNAPELIIKGTIVAGIIIVSAYIYDIHIVKDSRVTGVYGHLFSGPVAVIFLFISASSYKYFSNDKYWKSLILASVGLSFFTAIASKSGTAYSLMFLMCMVAPLVVTRKFRNIFLTYFALLLILIISFTFNSNVKKGVLRVTDSAELFLSIDNLTEHQGVLGTSGDRMAMWISSWTVFKDNMIFGIGRGNYNKSMIDYAEKGLVRNEMINYSHPHSIYFELILSKGLLGLSIFILLIAIIFKVYILAWKNNVIFSEAALLHVLAILLVGIGSEGPVLKNNFISIFLIYIAVFFSFFNSKVHRK